MRAIYLHRAYASVTRTRVLQYVPSKFGVRQFSNTVGRREENSPPEVNAPRKRGRPKKVDEKKAPTGIEVDSEAPAASLVPKSKPVKVKRPPKISDITRLIPPSVLTTGPTRSLRPYQEECVEACLNAISEGKRRLGISLATGAGKTVIFTNLIGKVQLEDPKRYQTFILVHRRELVEQAARHCVEVYPDKVLIL